MFLGQAFLIVTVKKLSAKTAWRLALAGIFVYILLLATLKDTFQFYISAILNGFTLYLFFVYYNIAHFANTPVKNRGRGSALMFNAITIVNIAAPLLAGFLSQINILLLWIFSIVFLLVCVFLLKFQEDFPVSYTLKEAWDEIKPTRIFILLGGIWEALVLGVIPIYTLFFFKTPLAYGIFLAYISVVAVVANFTLGKVTDRLQKRTVFLFPLTIGLTIATFLFPLATQNITLWLVVTGVTQFLVPLFWNISTAMVVDSQSNLNLAIPGRELVLALGRIIGLLLAFASFTLEKSPHYIFLILGTVMLFYPTILYWNKHLKKKYAYL